jgi:hypothetical protein
MVMLLVVGVSWIVWEIRDSLVRRDIGGQKTDLTIIITPGGSSAELEQSVKGLMRLLSEGRLDPRTRIVIASVWEGTETAEMARILERDYEPVTIGK